MTRIYTDKYKRISEDQRDPRHPRSFSFWFWLVQVRNNNNNNNIIIII